MTAIYLIGPVAAFAISIAHADPLDGITIEAEHHGSDYQRSKFKHWTDDDGDGQSTRHEVLIDESLVPTTLSEDGSTVIEGLWYCPFTDEVFLTPLRPGTTYAHLQIDHTVPLKEAWQSGAQSWTPAQREQYANDMTNPGHLIAVRGGTNGSKSFKDPAEWMPPNEDFHCAYALTWIGKERESGNCLWMMTRPRHCERSWLGVR